MDDEMEKKVGHLQYSVLMAVYGKDNPEYLEISIESMLNQTVPPEQFVIVVDGPVPDEIKQVIYKYQQDNNKLFTIILLKHNSGLGHALNIGLEQCRNELVARMDADDISLPERCEKELECFFRDKELDVCGCNIDEFLEKSTNVLSSRIVPSEHEQIRQFMRRRQAFNHPTVIYKRTTVLDVGGYKNLKRKEDFDLFSRILVSGSKTKNLNESLYLYRVSRDNYRRRKSWDNFRNAIYVYRWHMKRKGCNIIDFIIICAGEFIFLILPQPLMSKLSDLLLRKKYKLKNNYEAD